MEKVRIGVVGAGGIANMHLNAYKNVKEVQIVALCDINESVLNKTADKFGIEKRYTDINEMLKSEELDAIDVCVWNCSHAECSIAGLKAGVNVLCEKPMARTTAEAEEMMKVAKETGKLLMIGFVLRFGDETTVAQDFIDSGFVGDIYYTKATYLRRHGNPGGWFSDKSRSGGGPVIDLGVHVIDQTRFLMGGPKPVSVYAATFDKLGNRANLKTNVEWMPDGASDKDKCDVEDMGTALIRYDNGAITLLETSYSLNAEGVTAKDLYGTKGGLSLAGEPKLYTEINDYMVDVTPKIERLKGGGSMFEREMQHFVNCVLGKEECRATAEDGVVVMKILDAIYKSAQTGHEVVID